MLVIAESENVFRLYNLSTNFLKSSNVSLGSVMSTNFDNSSWICLAAFSVGTSTIVLIIVSRTVFF